MAVISKSGLSILGSVGLPAMCASRYSLSMAIMVACGAGCGIEIERRTARLVFADWEVLSNDADTVYRTRFGTYASPFSLNFWRAGMDVGAVARGRTTICDEVLIPLLEEAYARRQPCCGNMMAVEVLR